MIPPPDLTLPRKIAWGLVGILWFLWIAYEDQTLIAITVVAMAIAVAAGLTILGRWVGRETFTRREWLIRTGTVGLLAGAAVGPLSALLMLLKLGLHAHPEPDFTPEIFAAALSRTFGWAAIGALLGAAFGLLARE